MKHMPNHGEYDSNSMQWYCNYWMTKEEWLDIHDYAPVDVVPKEQKTEQF
ncbi:MAG: hypothetical protein WBQ25_23985 [Nitrososphaeraceae archaeon]|jgi:hypothetical protein